MDSEGIVKYRVLFKHNIPNLNKKQFLTSTSRHTLFIQQLKLKIAKKEKKDKVYPWYTVGQETTRKKWKAKAVLW